MCSDTQGLCENGGNPDEINPHLVRSSDTSLVPTHNRFSISVFFNEGRNEREGVRLLKWLSRRAGAKNRLRSLEMC